MFVDDAVGTLGSLDNGTAPSKLRSDRLAFCRNFERKRGGSVAKRPGRLKFAEIASAPENTIAPPLTNLGAASSSLSTGTLYVRLTYSTSAGETDDLHSTGNSIAVSSGESVKCWIPFSIINREVQYHDITAGTIRLKDYFNTTVIEEFANDTFNGYYLYIHDPSLADESGFGVNLEGHKLWDRTNYAALVSDYDATTYTFTLDRAVPADLAGKRISLLMPNPSGHLIRAANVYVSQNANGPFYISESVQPSEPTYVTITSIPTSNYQSPETRITRTAPTVAAATATYVDPLDGVTKNGLTGLLGGEYIIRYAWETRNAAHLNNGQWPEGSGFGLMARPFQTTQMAWPSKAARVSISDDQAISVTLPTFPSGAERALVSCRRVGTVSATLSTTSITNPSSTHRAYKYTPSGVGVATILDLSPAAFRAHADVSEVTTGNYTSLASADQSYYTSVATQAVNKTQLEFQLSAGQQSATTTALLVIGMKGVATNEHSPPSRPRITIRYRNDNTSSWVTLKNDITAGEVKYKTRRLGVAFSSNMLESGRFVVDISGQAGAGYSIDFAKLELYATSLATDPSVTSSDGIVEDTTSTTVTIQNPLLPSGKAEALRTNTTAQWPVSQLAASIGTSTSANPSDGVWHMVGCADAVFKVDANGTVTRVYSHDRPNGLTGKNSIEVLAAPWRMTNAFDRVFFCNPLSEFDRNFRFDGVQTHHMGLLAPPSSLPDAPDDGDADTDADPDPDDEGAARFTVLKEYWRIDEHGRPVDTHNPNDIEDPYRHPRWAVVDPDGRNWRFYDLRDLTYSSARNKAEAERLGLAGRIVNGARTNGFGSGKLNEVTGPYSAQIAEYLKTWTPPVSRVSHGDGEVPGADTETEAAAVAGVPAGKKTYALVAVRMLKERDKWNGYTVRSEPVAVARLTIDSRPAVVITNPDGSTTTEESTGSEVRVKVRAPPDPSVTHLELYRTLVSSAERLKMTERVELTPDAVDADGFITITDNKADDQLTLDMYWNTGAPPASTMMRFTQSGRCWGVPKYNQSAVWFSNQNSASGLNDPEGVSPFNVQVPQLERPAPVNALGVYADQIVVHTDNGMALQTGTSDDLFSGDPITFRPVFSDKGAMGPDCWANVDGYHYFTTKSGLYRMLGAEVSEAEPSGLVRGTTDRMSKTNQAAAYMSMVHHRDGGKSQLWASYSILPEGRCDSALVLEFNVPSTSEESGKEWRDWTEMWAASFARVETSDGSEQVMIGDPWGRIFRHGGANHDAGLHIDCELRSKPYQLGGEGKSVAPRYLFVEASGKSGHYLQFDFLKDLSGSRSNDRIQRFDLQGTGSNQWGDFVWGSFTWGESKHTGFREHRAHIGRVFRQLQLSMGQRWSDMPPGAKRDQTCEISKYRIAARPVGFRRLAS